MFNEFSVCNFLQNHQNGIEPGMYKQTMYGIRLSNVLEVYDTGKRQDESGPRFFGFRDVSLVPFHMKLIDRGQLSLQEVNLLN